MKVAVVTDSSSDIYESNESLTGIYKLPLQVSQEEDIYLEGETITKQEAFDMMNEGLIFQTSLPPVGRIEALFEQLKEEGYDLIFGVNISTGLSSTTSAMQGAAQTVGIDFEYFDAFTSGELLLTYAKAARTLFDNGFSVEEVQARLKEARDHSATFIVPDNLKHLMRSGRMSPTASILGGLLQIKPVLYLGQETGGKIEAEAKPRTMRKALNVVLDKYLEAGLDEDCIVYVVHVRNEEFALQLKEMIVERVAGVEIYVKELVTAVAIHVGLGAVATQYTRKIKTQ